eukprot:1361433-Rhodomonas_salina.1
MQGIGLTLQEIVMVIATLSVCTHLLEVDISENMLDSVIDKAQAEALAVEVVAKLPSLRCLLVAGRVRQRAVRNLEVANVDCKAPALGLTERMNNGAR